MFTLEMIVSLSKRCDRPDIATCVRWTLTSPLSQSCRGSSTSYQDNQEQVCYNNLDLVDLVDDDDDDDDLVGR